MLQHMAKNQPLGPVYNTGAIILPTYAWIITFISFVKSSDVSATLQQQLKERALSATDLDEAVKPEVALYKISHNVKMLPKVTTDALLILVFVVVIH
jgi:hypothetical protein